MHPLLDVKPWPRVLLQYPLLMLTAVLLGAGGGFAYSYAPLHRAKDWQIDYLQERLDSRTGQVESLERELVETRGALDGQPSSDELDAFRTRLDEATSMTGSLERQVRDLEKKLGQMTRSRDSWRKKHAAVTSEMEALEAASEPAVADAAAGPEAAADDATAAPSAPAAVPASPQASPQP